ncbi:MAG: hypothetical protein IPK85_14220 [Gemmatimonadetes bacterium]|nr:hypothetical protein [Gemmatimonadota bacterium]
MIVVRRPALLAIGSLLAASSVAAQVGHEPRRSPYRDLEWRQEITVFGGQFRAAVDPARVAPRNGPMIGAHYELRLGGPAYFTARMAGVLSDRTVIDPKLEKVNRVQDADHAVPLLLADVGFSLNLTGFKSYRGIVPFFGAGAGLGAGFEKQDVGGYQFGYPFLFTVRPGVKIATAGQWHMRLEATNYFYRIRYPETYFIKTGADDPVLEPGTSRNYWKRNLGLNLGMTYSYGR